MDFTSHLKNKKIWLSGMIFVILIMGAYYVYTHSPIIHADYKTAAEADPYVRFDMEAYDTILANYWKQATSSDMAQLYQLSLEKAAGLATAPTLMTSDRTGTADMLWSVFKTATSTDAERNLALNILQIALYNL